MKQYTVYDFAKKLMDDEEFNRGGIMKDERKYIDSIGFEYTIHWGQLYGHGEDLHEFFTAMWTLHELNKKYAPKGTT